MRNTRVVSAALSAAPGRQRVRLRVLTATGAVLLAGAHLLGVLPRLGGPSAGTALDLATVVAYVVLMGAQLELLRERLRASVLRAWLDGASGVLCLLALGCAFALEPLREVTGVSTPAATLLLVQASTSVLMLVFAACTASFDDEVRDVRVLLFITGTGALALVDMGSVLGALGLLEAVGGGPGRVVEVAVKVLVAGLVVLAAWRPRPPDLVTRDEGTPVVLLVPAATIGLCCGVLGLDHAVRLPTQAVVIALCCVAVTMVTVVLVFQQIASLHATRRQALTDELTGLGNRRALVARLGGVDAGAPLALVLVDLDRFKEVNDVLGHGAGDDLLRQVATRLLADSPDGELVVRQGGDEFALVVPGATAVVATARAAELVRRLGEPFSLGARQVSVAASVGVAAAPEHAIGAEELQRQADSAMYQAKAAGGGVQVYDHRTDAARRGEAALAAELRSAVASDALTVHFQPQLDAAGELVGVEALVRWEHPDRGLLGPAHFLGLAERHGLMDELTTVVLRRSLAQAAALRGGRPLRMSVNISATCLLNPRLVTSVAVLLAEHGVAASDLLLEITETELMLDAEVSRRVMADLVELGVGMSIDDYGTGYSSLAYLKDLPASELKLDRSFTAQLTTDRRTADIVRTTVDLAHSLGLLIVAEGVEDEPTLRQLRALGVDITQGYHHSHPLPAAELHRWVAAHRADHRVHHRAESVMPGA